MICVHCVHTSNQHREVSRSWTLMLPHGFASTLIQSYCYHDVLDGREFLFWSSCRYRPNLPFRLFLMACSWWCSGVAGRISSSCPTGSLADFKDLIFCRFGYLKLGVIWKSPPVSKLTLLLLLLSLKDWNFVVVFSIESRCAMQIANFILLFANCCLLININKMIFVGYLCVLSC